MKSDDGTSGLYRRSPAGCNAPQCAHTLPKSPHHPFDTLNRGPKGGEGNFLEQRSLQSWEPIQSSRIHFPDKDLLPLSPLAAPLTPHSPNRRSPHWKPSNGWHWLALLIRREGFTCVLWSLPYFSGYFCVQATVPLGPSQCGPWAMKENENKQVDSSSGSGGRRKGADQEAGCPLQKLS